MIHVELVAELVVSFPRVSFKIKCMNRTFSVVSAPIFGLVLEFKLVCLVLNANIEHNFFSCCALSFSMIDDAEGTFSSVLPENRAVRIRSSDGDSDAAYRPINM